MDLRGDAYPMPSLTGFEMSYRAGRHFNRLGALLHRAHVYELVPL
jgi:hypothetical protein